ncbi:MAG: hypothetical protein ACK5OC_28185 [Pirellula sp.]
MRSFLFGLSLMLALSAAAASIAQERSSGIELQHRSPKIGPGRNFYQYVNEGWLQNTPIPADQSNYGSFSVLDDGVKAATRMLIEEAASSNPAPGSDAQKVGDFFKSYTNIELRNQLGVRPIQPLLNEIATVKNSAQLATLAAKLNRLGVAGPMTMGVAQDAKKSAQYTVYISQSGLTLPDRDYYLKDESSIRQGSSRFEGLYRRYARRGRS